MDKPRAIPEIDREAQALEESSKNIDYKAFDRRMSELYEELVAAGKYWEADLDLFTNEKDTFFAE